MTGTGDGVGTCVIDQCPTIRAALSAAAATSGSDQINLAAATYQLTQGALVVNTPVTITGQGARSTAIVAAASSRVLELSATNALITALSVSGGTTTGSPGNGFHGGNILSRGGTTVLDHVRVSGGSASSGGGIANDNGTMSIQNSLIDHNVANQGGGDGGGIINFGGDGLGAASLTISDTTVAFNTALLTGGIIQYGSDNDALVLVSVTLARNATGSRGQGGGLNVGQGTVSAADTIFANNRGASGLDPNCSAPNLVSFGFNVDDGVDCLLSQSSDRSDSGVGLDTGLRNYGGQTDVLPFTDPSPALNIGGTCATSDQTGFARTIPCDAGAWEFRDAPVDTTAPETRIDSPGQTDPITSDPTFVFSADEAGVTFECSLDQGTPAWAACDSPTTYHGVPAGTPYTFRVRATDAAGNVDDSPAERAFTVGDVVPTPTPIATTAPTPVPTAVPTPAPTAAPTPETNKSVEAEVTGGKVLIRPKGARTFVALQDGVVPNGAEVDARRGTVAITTEKGERAIFYDGQFVVAQTGGITTLTLSEKLTGCPKAKQSSASAAASKPKTRKLWGEGKGKFRTKGQYSAATIRGTKWLVTDTCTSTVTKVAEGVVDVRDDVKKKTVALRKGKTYTARARR